VAFFCCYFLPSKQIVVKPKKGRKIKSFALFIYQIIKQWFLSFKCQTFFCCSRYCF